MDNDSQKALLSLLLPAGLVSMMSFEEASVADDKSPSVVPHVCTNKSSSLFKL